MNGHSDHKLFTYNNKGIVEESIEIVPNEIIEFKGNRYCFFNDSTAPKVVRQNSRVKTG